MDKRVVVTGMGLITPLGNDAREFFENALRGICRIAPIKKFDTSNYAVRIGGEIAIDEQELKLSARRLAEMPDIAKWGILAARKAVADAHIDLLKEAPDSIDVVMGVACPGLEVFQQQAIVVKEQGPSAAAPSAPMLANPGAPAIQIGIDLGLKGEVVNVSTGCSSSTCAIGYAMRLIQHGQSSCVLAGGVDEGVTPFMVGSFGNGAVLSRRNDDPVHASRPFDRQRDGYVLSDGAGVLVLEDYERAKARGAMIYCEVAGYGASSEAVSMAHVGKSEEPGAKAIEKALSSGKCSPEDVDYYCAHGSSSRWTDIRETRMVKRVFRERASKLAVSSIKSMIGHPLGAAGVLQTAASAMAIRDSAVPPTINYEENDPDCDLDYVPNEARAMKVRNAVVYSLGQGGNNAALVLRAC